MLFDNLSEMKSFGFLGFEEVQSLMNNNCSNVPHKKGVYFVIKYDDPPEFFMKSVGGNFKRKDPTVPIERLQRKWVNNTLVVYIGQSGGGTSSENLNSRLNTYMSFGQSNPVGHWGGRLIWQLKHNRKLKICWKSTPDQDPREVEKGLIKDFEDHYGNKPFANIRS